MLVDWHNHDNRLYNDNHTSLKTHLSVCNIYLNVKLNGDSPILMTISLLTFKLIKIWLYRIISTLLYLSSD